MGRRTFTVLIAVMGLLILGLGVANAGPGGKEKVEICHIPPGNPGQQHTITVAEPAVHAHLAHGDERGACDEERPGRDDDDTGRDEESPIARAGDNQCTIFDVQVQLDGSDSSDPDGNDAFLEFEWDFDSTPTGSDLDDGDLSNDEDDDPTFTPDQVGLYRLDLEVTDPDGNSDTDPVEIRVTMDVNLDKSSYDVDEGDTTPVEISFSENAPSDITVDIDVDDPDVAVVVEDLDDDENDAISDIEIEEGENSIIVYLFGVEDRNDNDESTQITVSVGTNACGDQDSAVVDVEDDTEVESLNSQDLGVSFGGTGSSTISNLLQLFIERVLMAVLGLR